LRFADCVDFTQGEAGTDRRASLVLFEGASILFGADTETDFSLIK
jgi:hypothetical protein